MFGMGGTEILVILIVALLFLGPDKLPEAAKTISKGIRDIKKQSRVLQRTIEDDEHIGGAIRDLRSALRGEEEPYRPKPKELDSTTSPTTEVVAAEPGSPQPDPILGSGDPAALPPGDSAEGDHMPNSMRAFAETSGGNAGTSSPDANDASASTSGASTSGAGAGAGASAAPTLTFPPTAGQPDEDAPPPTAAEDAALASLVKPAPNTIAHTPRAAGETSSSSGRKHG